MKKALTTLLIALASVLLHAQKTPTPKRLYITFFMDDYYKHNKPLYQAFMNTSNAGGTKEVFPERNRTVTFNVDFNQTGIAWFKSEKFPLTFIYINTYGLSEIDVAKWDYEFSINDVEAHFAPDSNGVANSYMIYYDKTVAQFVMNPIKTTNDVKRHVAQPRIPD